MMRRVSRFVLILLAVTMIPLCMGASCAEDARDAVTGAALDYVGGVASTTFESAFPLSTAIANLFAGPTGEQDQ
ncbi:MAG: hypothetical protein ACYSVY_15845 [Planctomycetota bacterium]|jgi:hypothetical protein